jgi:uncharacterized protein YodC (DUF2158 family)
MQVGDIVKLKSGGPLMTVLSVDNNQNVSCVYWNASTSAYDARAFAAVVLEVQGRAR